MKKCIISKRHNEATELDLFCSGCWLDLPPSTRRGIALAVKHGKQTDSIEVYNYWYFRGKAIAYLKAAQAKAQQDAKQGRP